MTDDKAAKAESKIVKDAASAFDQDVAAPKDGGDWFSSEAGPEPQKQTKPKGDQPKA